MSSTPTEKDSELNVLHDLLTVDGEIDGEDDTKEESALRRSASGRMLTTSTRHIPISRKRASYSSAANGSQRQKQQFTDKSRSKLASHPVRLASRVTAQNSQQNSHHGASSATGTGNKDTMKTSTASGTSTSNKQSTELADVRLKKLESERRRLERENEKKKRELEELQRQEMMIETAARKGDFSAKHTDRTKRSAELDENRSKRQKTGNTSEITIKHVSPVRSLNDGSAAEEEADLEEDHEGEDDDEDDEDNVNEESENSYSEVTVISVKSLGDDSESGSVEEESGDEDNSGSDDDNLSDETEESGSDTDDDASDQKDSAASDLSKKRRVAISPIRWKDADAADARKSDHQQPSRDHPSATSRNGRHSRSGSRQSSSRSADKLLKYIFLDTKYFLIKSGNHENVALAQARGVWSTPPSNELRLNQAFRTCSNVILIFSVKESGKFQGYARIATESDRNHPPIRWVLPQGLTARTLSSVFTLDWINRNELDFKETMHLSNKLNENNPIRIGRDGQPIDPVSGEALCRLFRTDRRIDLHAIALKSREAMEKRGIDPHEEYKRTEATRRKVKLEQEKRRAARRAERRNDERAKEPARRRSLPDDLVQHDRRQRRLSTSIDRGHHSSLSKASLITDRLRRLSDTSIRPPPTERLGRDNRPSLLPPSNRKALRQDDIRRKRMSAEGIRRRVLRMDMSPNRRLSGGGERRGFMPASPRVGSRQDRDFGRRSPPPLQSSRRSRIPNLLQMPPLPPPPPTMQSFTQMFHESRPHPAAFADYRRPLPPRRRSRERFGNGPMRPMVRPSSSDASWDRRRPARLY